MQIDNRVKVFSGNSYPELAHAIAEELGLELGKLKVGRYINGEVFIKIHDTVRGSDVFIVQPTFNPVNDNIMELLLMIYALKRSAADRVTAVIPYFGYCTQEYHPIARTSFSTRLVADLLYETGVDRIITVDFPHTQIQGFFNIPVDQIIGIPLFIEHYRKVLKDIDEYTIVASDYETTKKASIIASKTNSFKVAIIDERRDISYHKNFGANMLFINCNIIGDVGKKAILVGTLIDDIDSLKRKISTLLEVGVEELRICCSHLVLSSPIISEIEKMPIHELVTLDTIKVPFLEQKSKLKVIPITSVIADTINRIHDEMPTNRLI